MQKRPILTWVCAGMQIDSQHLMILNDTRIQVRLMLPTLMLTPSCIKLEGACDVWIGVPMLKDMLLCRMGTMRTGRKSMLQTLYAMRCSGEGSTRCAPFGFSASPPYSNDQLSGILCPPSVASPQQLLAALTMCTPRRSKWCCELTGSFTGLCRS